MNRKQFFARPPACTLEIYTGAMPPANGPPSGTLLASLRLIPRRVMADRVEYEAEAGAVAQAGGTPGYLRMTWRGQLMFQAVAGIGCGELMFPRPIRAGATVTIDEFVLYKD